MNKIAKNCIMLYSINELDISESPLAARWTIVWTPAPAMTPKWREVSSAVAASAHLQLPITLHLHWVLHLMWILGSRNIFNLHTSFRLIPWSSSGETLLDVMDVYPAGIASEMMRDGLS